MHTLSAAIGRTLLFELMSAAISLTIGLKCSASYLSFVSYCALDATTRPPRQLCFMQLPLYSKERTARDTAVDDIGHQSCLIDETSEHRREGGYIGYGLSIAYVECDTHDRCTVSEVGNVNASCGHAVGA